MVAQDVAQLWGFLRDHPDLHTNGYRYWEGIRKGMMMVGFVRESGSEQVGGEGLGKEGGKGKENDWGEEEEREGVWKKEDGVWKKTEAVWRDRDAETKVGMAIGRFKNAVPGSKRRRN